MSQAAVETSTSPVALARGWATRGLYLTRQLSLAAFFHPLMRVWHLALSPGARRPTALELKGLYQRYKDLLERDLANADQGLYPRELLFDYPHAEYLKQVPRGLLEFPRIYLRRARQRFDQLPPIPDRQAYPDYYLRTFHWQSDGWLSDRSAQLYDLSVETLFLGTADVMRRMVLPPLVQACQGVERPRVLDVASGTGRFLRMLHRTLPAARLYALDLSAPYLRQAAREVPGLSVVAENAESMSLKDDSFDALSCIYLFHELPRDARRRVLAEMLRVLKPGATAVVLDSAQYDDATDSGMLRYYLESFPVLYHEPYFKSYQGDLLEDAMREVGFEVRSVDAHFLSKRVVAQKSGTCRT